MFFNSFFCSFFAFIGLAKASSNFPEPSISRLSFHLSPPLFFSQSILAATLPFIALIYKASSTVWVRLPIIDSTSVLKSFDPSLQRQIVILLAPASSQAFFIVTPDLKDSMKAFFCRFLVYFFAFYFLFILFSPFPLLVYYS